MITTNIPTNTSTASALNAKVDIYNGATLVATCTCSENLQDFVLHREGDSSKFFGFGVSHKLDASFIDIHRGDPERELPTIEKGYTVKVALGSNNYFDYPYPTLYIVEVARNEKTNNITCVAYDLLAKASAHTVSELDIAYPASISTIASNCASLLGLSNVSFAGVEASLTAQEFDELNFNGDEPVKVLLDAIAEFTQTIYYINNQNVLVFKRLDRDGEPVLEVSKEKYFELTTLTPRTITGVCHATELGDNLTTSDESGVIQIMRDNPLYESNTNIATLLEEAAERVSGLTITQLECEWDGNHCLEIGDKLAFVTEDDNTVISYIINDVIEYQGFLNEITSWEYTQDEDETAANPTNIGDRISQTVAKVDKVNKEITLMVDTVETAKSIASELQIRTGEITATVKSIEATTNSTLEAVNSDIDTLAKEVSLKVDSEAVSIVVGQVLSEGVDKVVTASKHYTFDDNGLNIESSESEIKTTILEDGMRIYKNNQEVLSVDNQGVEAHDLYAKTFLIIGENSRLEDYGRRTACFWIGQAGG
jgi:hypothetical protein